MLLIFGHDLPIEFGLGSKVQYQTNLKVGRVEVVVKLTGSCRRQMLTGLDLQDESFIHDQIDPVGAEPFALVIDRNAHFPSNTVASHHEFGGQRQNIRLLDKPKSELTVNVKECADY